MKKTIPYTIAKIAGIYVICLLIHFLVSFITHDPFEITWQGEVIILAVIAFLCVAEAAWKTRTSKTT